MLLQGVGDRTCCCCCYCLWAGLGWAGLGGCGCWCERRTLEMVRAGLHWSFKMSRQMLPWLLTLGWYTLVWNATWADTQTQKRGVRSSCTGARKVSLAVAWLHGMTNRGRQAGCCAEVTVAGRSLAPGCTASLLAKWTA
jgi:hypothetical protein